MKNQPFGKVVRFHLIWMEIHNSSQCVGPSVDTPVTPSKSRGLEQRQVHKYSTPSITLQTEGAEEKLAFQFVWCYCTIGPYNPSWLFQMMACSRKLLSILL